LHFQNNEGILYTCYTHIISFLLFIILCILHFFNCTFLDTACLHMHLSLCVSTHTYTYFMTILYIIFPCNCSGVTPIPLAFVCTLRCTPLRSAALQIYPTFSGLKSSSLQKQFLTLKDHFLIRSQLSQIS
jgi:hypothetical protein